MKMTRLLEIQSQRLGEPLSVICEDDALQINASLVAMISLKHRLRGAPLTSA
jgi:hypothetical protein|eukprot:COSAG01_NODE_1631_length_9673_cov_489.564550_5_plen_52_part_00